MTYVRFLLINRFSFHIRWFDFESRLWIFREGDSTAPKIICRFHFLWSMNCTEPSTHFQYCPIEGFILFGHNSWRLCANGCWRNVQYWNPPPSGCKSFHSNLKTGSLNKLFDLQIINTTIVYLVSLYTFRWKLWKCSIKHRTLLCSQFYQCIFRSQICNFCVSTFLMNVTV